MDKYYKKWFGVLILPAVILFVFVVLIPFAMGVLYSFSNWRGTYFVGRGNVFQSLCGFQNYVKAFANSKFTTALLYTVKYTAVAVVSINIVALAFAMMVTKIGKGAGIFRTIFFMPNLLGGLALGFIWQFIFQVIYTDIVFSPSGLLHIEALRYMTQDPVKALFALVIMTTWQFAGYMMIIYVDGLNNIPSDLYEAAEIDGANGVQKFFKITVPMLMPSFTVVIFLTLSNSFKLLDQNVALTNGDFSTRMIALQILRTIKDTFPPNYGVAQAQSVVFFLIVASITLLQVILTKRKEVEM